MNKFINLIFLTSLCLSVFNYDRFDQDQKGEKSIVDTSHYHVANEYALVEELPFAPGELLNFKASVGFVNAAEADLSISEIVYNTDQAPAWQLDVKARTLGVFDLVSPVRDNWGSYVDTTTLATQQFYRYIREGGYRKNERVYFDHEIDTAHVLKLHKETKAIEKEVSFRVSKNVHDMVSSFYYLRSIDWSQFQDGDIITVNVFFDDKLEAQRVKLVGREVIKTKLGKMKAILLVPIREEDSLFVEENTVRVWLSDDLNKIPLKVKAKIFVGYLKVDLKTAKNIRHPLALVD
jgi:hypothetical protein